MTYRVVARFYRGKDQMDESYVIISDNSEKDTRIEVGSKVKIYEVENEPVNAVDSENEPGNCPPVGRGVGALKPPACR
uniref:Uncharacterized protein n=1 Tax=viral metagenome TaxID=1070528 RepID=A0A6H2A3B2_9ZZZZ